LLPVCLSVAAGFGILQAADWICAGGNAQHTNWQRNETLLTPTSAKDLKLVWTKKLEGSLTAPVMLGRVVTHKGIKDLLFVASNANDVYAIDPDLGTLFWNRHLEDPAPGTCNGGLTAAPALAEPEADSDGDDDDNDITFGIRPLYVLASSGKLYSLNPRTGGNLIEPVPFIPPTARAFDLYSVQKKLYALTENACGNQTSKVHVVDLSGKTPQLLHRSFAKRNTTIRAIWQDTGKRWISVGTKDGVTTSVADKRAWSADDLGAPVSIAGANRVLFVLTKDTLFALDALSGRRLYSSGDEIKSAVTNSGLAIANGHVCFGDSEGTVYCFGFPIDL
jgi:outer membrane protein assembly factor BamB